MKIFLRLVGLAILLVCVIYFFAIPYVEDIQRQGREVEKNRLLNIIFKFNIPLSEKNKEWRQLVEMGIDKGTLRLILRSCYEKLLAVEAAQLLLKQQTDIDDLRIILRSNADQCKEEACERFLKYDIDNSIFEIILNTGGNYGKPWSLKIAEQWLKQNPSDSDIYFMICYVAPPQNEIAWERLVIENTPDHAMIKIVASNNEPCSSMAKKELSKRWQNNK